MVMEAGTLQEKKSNISDEKKYFCMMPNMSMSWFSVSKPGPAEAATWTWLSSASQGGSLKEVLSCVTQVNATCDFSQ